MTKFPHGPRTDSPRSLPRAGAGRVVALAAAVLTVSAPAEVGAQELPPIVTLEELLELVRAESPQLAAEHVRVEVAASEVIEARTLPNPEIHYEGFRHRTGVNPLDGRETLTLLELPVPIPGQRRSRIRAAQLRAGTAELEYDLAVTELVAEVRQSFVGVLAHQGRIELLDDLLSDLRGIEENVAVRVDVGDRSPYDLLRVRIEIASIERELASERIEREAAAGLLGQIVGSPGWTPRIEGDLEPVGVTGAVDELWEEAERRIPGVRAAESAEAAAASGISVARWELLPAPVLALGGLRVTDEPGSAAMLSVSFEVPLFNRGQGPLAEARAGARLARIELSAERTRARSQLDRAVRRLEGRRANLETFRREVIEQVPLLRRSAEDAYLLGELSVVELLDAFQALAEARLSHIDLVEGVMQAEVEVLAAAGVPDASPEH